MVTDYLEDALSPQALQRFERHVKRCTGCSVYLDQMRKTVRLVGLCSSAWE
jgi:hypothetical protein